MDVGGLFNYSEKQDRNLSPGLIWLAGAIAACRGLLATVFPAIRSALNL